MNCGIYKIVNLITNKVYIGSSNIISRRIRDHINKLNRYAHVNKYLQASWNLHGEKAFLFEIVEYCEKDILLEKEQHWINLFNCVVPNGYNLVPIASKGTTGFKHSKEFGEKVRARRLGKPLSAETIAKISESQKGKYVNEETKEKIRIAKSHPFVNQDRWGIKYNKLDRIWNCFDGQKCTCHKCRTKKSDYMRKYRDRKEKQ